MDDSCPPALTPCCVKHSHWPGQPCYRQDDRRESASEKSLLSSAIFGSYASIPNEEDFQPHSVLYSYDPLPGPDFIRILLLYPASHYLDSVCGSIVTVPLKRTSHYAALSYSWGLDKTGDVSANSTIIIGGRELLVSQNLFQALQRLRSSSRPQPVWIDAICIDQNDVVERNSQVSRMAKVYRYAARVVTWLGEGRYRAEDTSALAILKCLSHAPRKHHDHTHSFRTTDNDVVSCCTFVRLLWDLALRIRPSEAFTQWLQGAGLHPHEDNDLRYHDKRIFRYRLNNIVRILGAFLRRRYFKRRWIVQELYHCKQDQALLAWGPCLMPLEEVLTALANIQHFVEITRSAWLTLGLDRKDSGIDFDSGSLSPEYLKLAQIEALACDIYNMLSMKSGEGGSLTLYDALGRCSGLGCADPRDIVFALVSLDPSFGLEADYRLSLTEVYTSFARLLIQRGLIELVFHNLRDRATSTKSSKSISLNGPTWVPDLRKGFVDGNSVLLRASVGANNIVLVPMFMLGFVAAKGVSTYDGLVVKDEKDVIVDYTDGQTVVELQRQSNNAAYGDPYAGTQAHVRWSRFRDKVQSILAISKTAYSVPNRALRSRSIEPGDMICTTREQWWDSEDAQIVVLRCLQDDESLTKIVGVFSSQDYKPAGLIATDRDKLLAQTYQITVKII